ncbi:hypothetical protein [Micromonospora sp. DT227]|uniref:hypothetical protein n=1 Tax=Micromonospora sp. DT227 TaxID=3393433 RepID=UPI003CEFD958
MNEATLQPTAPDKTTYGTREDFDYDGFTFSDDFPVPAVYVVVQGIAYFQGPDGFLWFAPDQGFDNKYLIDWRYPQNVAEFDERQGEPDRDEAGYLAVIAALCEQVEAITAAAARGVEWDAARRA